MNFNPPVDEIAKLNFHNKFHLRQTCRRDNSMTLEIHPNNETDSI